jgi:D-serine deaminase-like pyridoxal phosphate-dependent protein
MIRIAGSPGRLVPHVKTHKMPAIVKMQIEAGIHRFKCATIAEAEMLAGSSAKEVLVAYQLNEPKALRFLQLIKQYPKTHFTSLVDNMESAQMLENLFAKNSLTATVYIDIDNGMHRTGISVNKNIAELYKQLEAMPHLHCAGLHVYDGHIRAANFEERKQLCEAAFLLVKNIAQKIEAAGFPKPEIIAGGSPTFPIHALNPEVLCSPGTSLLWDKGYASLLPEQPFLIAAVIVTRIISKPVPGRITTDLGHKSVSAENPIDKRIFFLNLKSYEVISQSEEHLVVKINEADGNTLKTGDVLYGIPYHICPTVALYDEVQVVENGNVTKQWQVEARKKKISI